MRQIEPLGENAGRAEPPRSNAIAGANAFFQSMITVKVPLSKVSVPSEPAT